MREIKFRAWDTQSCTWADPSHMISLDIHLGGTFSFAFPQSLEVMQYTGLKDKNGKEIYEGDVIHCTAGMRTPDKTFQTDETKAIAFEDGAFRYDGVTLGDMTNAHMSEYTFEVIGNIYENPELLENKTITL